MLGRLGMDVDECISAYVELIKTIFEEKNELAACWRHRKDKVPI
jgi:hypothetical protein